MNRYFKTGFLLLAVLSLTCCKNEMIEEGLRPENVVSFTIGNDATTTKASASCNEIQVASYAIEGVEDNDLALVETVSSADNLYSTYAPETKGTPVYTENFDALYGTQVYATAYAPKTGAATAYTDGEVWGSYLENGGTVNLKNTDANTYSYDYTKGQAVNLSWPDGGKLLYFIQAPDTTKALNPKFYSDGSIEFDYTDPTTPTTVEGRQTIVNGASAQKDILFTSKIVSKPAEGGNHNNILMYHALTAVKFKVGNIDERIETIINSITLKGITANGHCTIVPNYGDSNTSAGDNPSNASGAETTKSSKCATWENLASPLVVDYTHNFSGKTSYTTENSDFASSFYNGTTAEKNLINAADGGEVMLMVPQTLNNVEVIVNFSLKAKNTGVLVGTYSRSVKLSSTWKPGELHTYTLTVNKVSVSVTDTMNDTKEVKSALSTSNSGNVTAYLRATYAVAWYYGYGDDAICVASWHGHGKFTYLGEPDEENDYENTWIKGSDGYYYYVNPVLPGRPTQFPLFTTFSAASITEEPVFPKSHLEMKILLQGVQFDASQEKVTAAWGNIDEVDKDGNPTGKKIVELLSTKPENIDL